MFLDRFAVFGKQSAPLAERLMDNEKRVGGRDITRWGTTVGRQLVRLARFVERKFSANAVLYGTAAAGGVAVVGLAAVGAEIYDAVSDNDGISAMDRPVLDAAIGMRTPLNEFVIAWFSQLGGPIGMPIIATVITLLMARRWRSLTPIVLMVIGVAVSLIMTTVGKAVVGRVRPPLNDAVPPFEYAPSFPSGHALNSTVVAGLLAYVLILHLQRRSRELIAVLIAATWALSMGASRVFLGHHWLTDVVFAWTLGMAWVSAVVTSHRLFLTVRKSRVLATAAPA